jgi:protein ImuB
MSRPVAQYACLYVEELPVQARLRLRPELRNKPCAVIEGTAPLQQVCSFNAQARILGIEHGMTKLELETIPATIVLERSIAEEESARTALLGCARGFSPSIEGSIESATFRCVLNIAGTQRLFGPPASLARALLDRLQALGIAAQVAIASNFHTAVCLARGMPSRVDITVVPPGEELSALGPLPLRVLDLPEEQSATFALWGIKTLGMLAALPEKPLIARMGQEGYRLRQLACGMLPHLFMPIELPFVLEELIELDSPVELLDSLLFVLGALLGQLIARAVDHALALASVTLSLNLECGRAHHSTVQPALPTNDKQLWVKLLHLDLEAHPPGSTVLSVRLTAEPGHTGKVQLGLFSPQLPDMMRLDVTLARIRAIVGEECVGSPKLGDSHLPDDFAIMPFRISSEPASQPAATRTAMAMRRLRPAENVAVILHNQRPSSMFFRKKRYAMERVHGPWLANGNWWSNARWGMQEWDIVSRSTDGSQLCGCLVRNLSLNQWQMAGLYD